MKDNIKYKLFGGISSDGSVLISPVRDSQQFLRVKNVDIINHPVWTGRRPKEQTEISAFIDRFVGKDGVG